AFDIFDNDRIGTDPRVGANLDRTQDLCSSPDVHVVSDARRTPTHSGPDCNLLKDETVDSDACIRMDNDAVGVRNEQPAPDVAVQRNIGSGDDAPKSVTE